MRRAVLVTAILVMMFLAGPIAQVTVVEANPFSGPSLWIESPLPRIYPTTTISVIFHVDTPLQNPKIVKMSYSLDGAANRTLIISNSQSLKFGTPSFSYVGTGVLENLGNGTHSVEVYALDAQGNIMSYPSGRTFLINTTFRSPILLLSPSNATYSKNDLIQLIYTINEEANCEVHYSLDNWPFRNIAGNITLPALSEGQHTIKVRTATSIAATGNSSTEEFHPEPINFTYLEQVDSLYSEQIAHFTIKTTESQQPLATSNLTIVLVIVTIAMISLVISVIVYKRGKLTSKQSLL